MKRLHKILLYVILISSLYTPFIIAQNASDDDEVILTFITANDGHWRPAEIDTSIDWLNRMMMQAINDRGDVDLVIFNGDLVDRGAYISWYNEQNPDNPLSDRDSSFNIPWLYDVKEIYDKLTMPYYVVQGNHDRASWEFWEEVWGYPAKHHFVYEGYAFVLLTRHDDRRIYHPVDYDWLNDVLNLYEYNQGVFIFMHAGDSDVMNTEFYEFIDEFSNVKGVFFGHTHEDSLKSVDGLHYFWNGNFMNPFFHYGYRVVYIYESGKIDTYFKHLGLDKKTNRVTLIPTRVTGESYEDIPEKFQLHRNYPNPFNPSTTISYSIPAAAEVTITIYTITGQQVETVVNEHHQPGYYRVTWHPSPEISAGIYFYTLTTAGDEKSGTSVSIQRSMIYLR